MSKKIEIFFKILRIIVLIGWISFFAYNIYVAKYLGNQYLAHPDNFIMFPNETERSNYYESLSVLSDREWVKEANLASECRPMLFFNDFYFQKIYPVQNWMLLLILFTIVIRTEPDEWSKLIKKLENLEDDDKL